MSRPRLGRWRAGPFARSSLILTLAAAAAACAPPAPEPAGGGSLPSAPTGPPAEPRPAAEDSAEIAFATIYDSAPGRRMFREVVAPLMAEGVPAAVTVMAVRPRDAAPERVARCLGDDADAFRQAVLSLDDLPDPEGELDSYLALADSPDPGALAACAESDEVVVAVEQDRIALQRASAPTMAIPTPSGGTVSAVVLPFMALGPYRVPREAGIDQARILVDAIAAGEPPAGARLVVAEGHCPGCMIDEFVLQVANHPDLQVDWVEWRPEGDTLGDWYVTATDPQFLPVMVLEGHPTVRGRTAAVFEERGGLQVVTGLAMNGVMRMRGVDSISGGHLEGEAGVPVLHTFEDFQCPGCGEFNRRYVPQIERDLVATGRLALSFHHFPLQNIHPQAFSAAVAAECAGEQGRFVDYKRVLFNNQSALEGASLVRYAGQVGLDVDAFQACREGAAASARVRADIDLGQSVGVSGTPSLFLPPYKLSFPEGYFYLEHLLSILEAEGA